MKVALPWIIAGLLAVALIVGVFITRDSGRSWEEYNGCLDAGHGALCQQWKPALP